MDVDVEKAIGLDGDEGSAVGNRNDGVGLQGPSPRPPSHDSGILTTIRSHRSRGGGEGHDCLDDTEPNTHTAEKSTAGVAPDEPFLAAWDGDADPEDPRSMTKLRRWAIVLICAASSLCVCVMDSLWKSYAGSTS